VLSVGHASARNCILYIGYTRAGVSTLVPKLLVCAFGLLQLLPADSPNRDLLDQEIRIIPDISLLGLLNRLRWDRYVVLKRW
jgi:hypothetical protein